MAGQTDNKLAVLKIDDATGRLSTTGQTAMVGSPVCVIFEKP
jgi:6-phosphogluconolactonase (cycloisomerase 2 family)